MIKPQPVFVLGSARNGTTWLGNVLCRHPEIVGVQHEYHWGIHESKIRHNEVYWGDLSTPDAFISFLERYASADYFRLAGVKKSTFYRNPPRSFIDFFFELMDRMSEKRRVSYWTTKIDPAFYHRPRDFSRFIEKAQQRYKDCRFISIRRDEIEVLKSYLSMEGVAQQRRSAPGVSLLATILCMARMRVHYDNIQAISPPEGTLFISFQDFKSQHEAVVREILDHIGLSFDERMLEQVYLPNSSFRYKRQTDDHATEVRFARRVLLPLFRRFPSLAQLILLARESARRPWCPLSWRLLKMEYMPDVLRRELEESGDWGLLQQIFGDSSLHEKQV